MALSRLGNRTRAGDFTWPGFVDALASLLMVFVFVLMVFVLIQANLAYRLSGQDESLIILREELAMLGDLLSLEREAGAVLSADLARTQAQLEMAENQNSLLTAQLSSLTAQLTDEKTKTTTLKNTLATERLRLTTELTTLSAQTAEQASELEQMSKSLDQKTQSLKQAATDLSAEQKQSEQARLEIDRLTAAMQSLRFELTRLRTLLSEKQEQSKKDKIAIANLGKELNAALANKVQELQRFRSEFFGRLRTILEGRSDVKVVGDRFVFQSEVLFAPGQASINPEGQAQLGQIADAIMQIIADIPSDIPWILQVEGHTDDIPVSGVYTDNWDLSTERALSVVRFMVDRGVPSERLAATGYGEFQPITSGKTDADRQKNRRIELKLTQTVRMQ
ncbi:MAG: flagellar motor protein MotB [Alphaproteobacteria bacterium]|nr:MAG: flagellar motor protein MotB [Alphaproteobacteria bacterium]